MVEISWFFYSIIATIAFGLFVALLKLPSAKKQSSFVTMSWFMLTLTILAVVIFRDKIFPVNSYLLLTAAAWAFFFVSLTLIQMFSLKHINANVLFPITTTLSLIGVSIIGLTFFKDRLSLIQILGVILIILIVYFFLRKNGQIKLGPKVIFIGLIIISFSIIGKSIQKIAATNFDIYTYLIYQSLIGFVFVFLFTIIYHKKEIMKSVNKRNAFHGFLLGIVQFVGVLSILKALSIGPFTPIMAIHSTYILVTAITTSLFFKEKLTRKILLLTLVAIVGVILIRLG